MKRVLLIEDLPQVAAHLKGMLAREKEVEVAGVQAQAEAGIAQATTEKPDVVVVGSYSLPLSISSFSMAI